jgi:hypothetical protein
MNNTHYLMLCELHYPPLHGKTSSSDTNIENHYLVYDRFDPFTGLALSCIEDNYYENRQNEIYRLNDVVRFLQSHYSTPNNVSFNNHPTIRNYHNIVNMENYIKPEIGQYIILPTHEAVAILKTFWIRIIQRKWKKIVAERNQIMMRRISPIALHIRQVTGKWPDNCNYLPGVKGMLINI